MTDQRTSDQRRDRRGGAQGYRSSDNPGPVRQEPKRDPGAYIGRMPERAAATIPGGVGPKDQRVSAVATQPEPVRGETPASADAGPGDGNDTLREAGQNR